MLWLTEEEVISLTGYKHRKKQLQVLAMQGTGPVAVLSICSAMSAFDRVFAGFKPELTTADTSTGAA